MSTSIQKADALVTALNDHDFGPEFGPGQPYEFTAVRHYLPRFKLTKGELDKLAVVVVPGPFNTDRSGRTDVDRTDQTFIGILRKLQTKERDTHADQLAEIDPLVNFVEAIGELLNPTDDHVFELPGIEIPILAVEAAPLYDPDHMERMRQFTSVLAVSTQDYQ